MKKQNRVGLYLLVTALITCAVIALCCEEDNRYLYGPSCPRDTVYVVGDPDTVTVLPRDLSCDSCHHFHPHHKRHK